MKTPNIFVEDLHRRLQREHREHLLRSDKERRAGVVILWFLAAVLAMAYVVAVTGCHCPRPTYPDARVVNPSGKITYLDHR